MRLLPLISALGVSLMLVPLSFGEDPSPGSERFAYDRAADLAVEVQTEEVHGAVRVREVTFCANPAEPETRTPALLISPVEGEPVRGGILWGHWLGEPETTNRSQFRAEAEAWARRGFVSVLPDMMWATPRWYQDRVLEEDFAHGVGQVVALRRALDLLFVQPGVDPGHAALVAHDYSAMYGSLALAVDGRIRRAVLIAAAPSLEDWAFYVRKPDSMEDYLAQNEPLSLARAFGAMGGMDVLVQFAGRDPYVPAERAALLVESLAARKVVITYPEAGHEMTAPAEILADRTAWLEGAFGLE